MSSDKLVAQGNVTKQINKFEELTKKPERPPKKFKLVNGEPVRIDNINNNDSIKTSQIDVNNNDSQATNHHQEISNKLEDETKRSESSGSDNESDQGLTQPEKVTKECFDYIDQVRRALRDSLAFKPYLFKAFSNQDESIKGLNSVFKDVGSLNSLYEFIDEIRKKLIQNPLKPNYTLPDIFLDKSVSSFLKMYRSFLTSYQENAKWLGNLQRTNLNLFTSACDTARQEEQLDQMASLDNRLYTVFNSLFVFQMFFDRYMKYFERDDEEYKKAEQAKENLTSLLTDVNNQDREAFFTTQEELNLLKGREREPKINSKFIFKEEVKKIARRDGQICPRLLVLFSDCLYITLLPNAITGQCSVRQELSLAGMKLTEIEEQIPELQNTSKPTNNHDSIFYESSTIIPIPDPNSNDQTDDQTWISIIPHKSAPIPVQSTAATILLNIRSREADMDFSFESYDKLCHWKNLLADAINAVSTNNLDDTIDENNVSSWLGKVAPRWQKDQMTRFCNGHDCKKEFNTKIRKHHCRADGLIYCDSCCDRQIHLGFGSNSETYRVCHLCYDILFSLSNGSQPEKLQDAKKKLEHVFKSKTRNGVLNGWLTVQTYISEHKKWSSPNKLFCDIENEPIIKLFQCPEDNKFHDIVMLVGTELCRKEKCKYHSRLKPTDFCIEHKDTKKFYLFKCDNIDDCNKWTNTIDENLKNFYSN